MLVLGTPLKLGHGLVLFISTHTNTSAHTYTRRQIHTYIQTHRHTQTHTDTQTQTHTCTYPQTNTHVYRHTDTHADTQKHTYTHTHTNTPCCRRATGRWSVVWRAWPLPKAIWQAWDKNWLLDVCPLPWSWPRWGCDVLTLCLSNTLERSRCSWNDLNQERLAGWMSSTLVRPNRRY